MVDATVISGKAYPVGNESDPLKMPYRLMVRDEDLGPVVRECSNTLQGIAYALGFEQGFGAGDSNPHVDTYWIEELVDNEWREVELDFT